MLPRYKGVIISSYKDPVINQSVSWNVIRDFGRCSFIRIVFGPTDHCSPVNHITGVGMRILIPWRAIQFLPWHRGIHFDHLAASLLRDEDGEVLVG